MKIFLSKRITSIAVATITSIGAFVSLTDVAAAQITSKPITIIDHDPGTATPFIKNPGYLDEVIKSCPYLGTPPKKGPNALVKKYCSLLATCLERLMTGAKRPVKVGGKPVSPAYKPTREDDLHPLDIKQSMEAIELACLTRYLK